MRIYFIFLVITIFITIGCGDELPLPPNQERIVADAKLIVRVDIIATEPADPQVEGGLVRYDKIHFSKRRVLKGEIEGERLLLEKFAAPAMMLDHYRTGSDMIVFINDFKTTGGVTLIKDFSVQRSDKTRWLNRHEKAIVDYLRE